MNAPSSRLLIVGSGDIARRIVPLLGGRYRLYALIRDAGQAALWRALGATPVLADLDRRETLTRIAGLADHVLHLAPPPNQGERDSRTRHLLAALARKAPRQLVYVSTTGVYGDCAGDRIDETRRLHPESIRARRRVDAETQIRAFGRRHGIRTVLLRAPGIYAGDRLPLERLRNGLPALSVEDDVYTNHIHADDLAAVCLAALRRGGSGRAYNVVDDSQMKMGDYFDLVADALSLPRPPRLAAAIVRQTLSPLQWSFMRESRRIANRRLQRELQYRLRYRTVADGIAEAVRTFRSGRLPPC